MRTPDPIVMTHKVTVPIYVRLNGQEISLGTCEIDVPVHITIRPVDRRDDAQG